MQFIGRIKLNAPKTSTKEVFINIGLVSIIVAIVIEIYLGNYVTLALIIPFLYLLSIRKTAGRGLYKEVLIQLDRNNDDYSMTLPNSVFVRNQLCSCVYSFKQSEFYNITYNQNTGCATIKFLGNKVVYFGDQELKRSLAIEVVLSLYITLEQYSMMHNFLNIPSGYGRGQEDEL